MYDVSLYKRLLSARMSRESIKNEKIIKTRVFFQYRLEGQIDGPIDGQIDEL
mgnify:CR=1 FL=1